MVQTMSFFHDMTGKFPMLSGCESDVKRMIDALVKCFEGGGSLYICGNGGSAADALHITGEMMKSFKQKRAVDEGFASRLRSLFPEEAEDFVTKLQGALPTVALVESTALTTAFANDVDISYVFAQQVYGLAREGDAVLGISTSGNSANVLKALMAAKARGATALGLAGATGGKMKGLCEVCVCVPETDAYKVQELHLPVYHTLCLALEEHFWGVKE